jgi:hypothetical protein
MDVTWFIFLGFLLVIVASALETYCSFGRLARPDIKPRLLKSWFRWVLEVLWVILLITGCSLPFLFRWDLFGLILSGIAVVSFWLVLPFLLNPIMRNRLLPNWDEVKAELKPKGYDEKNYWRGDWWMVEDKKKLKKKR